MTRHLIRLVAADLVLVPMLSAALSVPVGLLLVTTTNRTLGFDDPGSETVLLLVIAVGFWLGGMVYGASKGIADYRRLQTYTRVGRFMGPDKSTDVEVLRGAVYRSSGGTRQFRFTRADTLEGKWNQRAHFHLERLQQNGQVVTESSSIAIGWPTKKAASGSATFRLYASVGPASRGPFVRHFWGEPPEMTDGQKPRKMLPWPRLLVTEERGEGTFLWRFSADGAYGGDTWHEGVEEAKRQAEYEYGDLLGEWTEVPEGVPDAAAYALEQVATTGSGS